METQLQTLADQIVLAKSTGQALRIQGGGSKHFYGEPFAGGQTLSTLDWAGIVDYEPSELVITAKCGTPLKLIEDALAQQGQMLGFEPPHFAASATVGGCVSAGISGPRRAAAGAVRDFVLGAKLLDGQGEHLNFGGQVMKNVAGYDVSRLLCGAMGTLGLITQVSLKVLPVPLAETTVAIAMDQAAALLQMNQWAGQPLPISASTWCDGCLYIRLSGSQVALDSARKTICGDLLDNAAVFWMSVREQSHAFFAPVPALWRLSLPSVSPVFESANSANHQTLIEWNGAQRWIHGDGSEQEAQQIRAVAKKLGGHAVLFRSANSAVPRFDRPADGVMQLNRAMKIQFDAKGIFNPGRMFAGL